MAAGRRETSQDVPVCVRVLGPVVIEGRGGSIEVRGRQAGAVVAFLALERRPTTRDELADVLWGLNLSSHWQGALRGVLSKVRTAWVEAGLPGDEIRSTDALIRLDTTSITTDLDDIEALLTSPHQAATLAKLAAATSALAQPFLPHDDSEWGTRIRQRIEATTRRVVHLHARQLIDARRDESATAVLEQAITHDPLDEIAYHLLIESRLRLGQRAAAGSVYESLTTQLAAEFGISPSPSTSALLTSSGNLTAASRSPQTSGSRDDVRDGSRRGSIHPHSADPFVGRRIELDQLGAIWQRVIDERHPQLAVIQGAPGMGKTRLVDEFCSDRRGRPPIRRVVWGRNRGNIDRAYGALAEAIERLLADEPELIARLGHHISGLLPLLPHLARATDRPQPDDDSARTHLIHSLRALVVELTDEPTVWFVDDLQWASADALGVVEAALDGVVGPLFVVVTSRYPPSEIAAGLASLQRVVTTTTIHLEGLSVDDVTELFDDAAVARTVQERTAGLPFYASEIARLSRLTGGTIDLDTVPSTIADWVSRRVAALGRPHAQMLQLASVIGNEFDLDLLTRCSSADAIDVAAVTDELVTYGLLSYQVEPRNAGTSSTQVTADSTLQFTHMITRDIVYDGIGPGTRTQLHRRVAQMFEAQSSGSRAVATLAHHYAHAGREFRSTASEYSLRAGHQALATGAWANAEDHFTCAADLASTPHQRAAALVGLGRALLSEGQFAGAHAVLLEAIEIAEDQRLPVVQAMATLVLVGRAGRGASARADDADHVRRLRAALAELGRAPDDSPLELNDDPVDGGSVLPNGTPSRAELLSSLERELALSLLLTDAADERSTLLHRSLQRARSIQPSSHTAVANALLGIRYAKLEPNQLDSRLSDIDEVLAIPTHDLGDEVRLAAYCYRHEDLLRRCDPIAAQEALVRAERIAADFPHPYWTWAVRTWRALSHVDAGDLERAERGAFEAHALRAEIEAASACLAVNLVNIRLFQGRSDEMIPTLAAAVDRDPAIPAYRAVLALCAAESGDGVHASRLLRSFADSSFTNLPDDTNRFLGLAVLGHVAATVGDREAGRLLAGLLEPFRHQWVVLQCYGGGGATWGPTAHVLARLAALDGRVDDATELFETAASCASHSPLVLAKIDAHRGLHYS